MQTSPIPAVLRKPFLSFVALTIFFCITFYFALDRIWQAGDFALRISLVALGLLFVFLYLYKNLHENHRTDSPEILPEFGTANSLTLLRGILSACLLFFVGAPRPPARLAWIPGIVFLLLSLTDSLDGFIARRTNRTTLLGKKLDLTFDSFAVLVGILLAVGYGQTPAWFVFIGILPFIFRGLVKLRKRFGRAVEPLPPRQSRAIIGGFLFGYLCFALSPLLPAWFTKFAGTLVTAAILFSFGRDWLFTVGIVDHTAGKRDFEQKKPEL